MIFSRAVDYAIKSLVYMTREQNNNFYSVNELTEAIGSSRTYLSKVLRKLTSDGYLKSVPGTSGGYILNKKPGKIKLIHIIKSFGEEDNMDHCFFGWAECGEANPCPFHNKWKKFKNDIHLNLKEMSITDVAKNSWPGI